MDAAFLSRAVNPSLASRLTALGIHPYPKTGPEAIALELEMLREWVARTFGDGVEIWDTEWDTRRRMLPKTLPRTSCRGRAIADIPIKCISLSSRASHCRSNRADRSCAPDSQGSGPSSRRSYQTATAVRGSRPWHLADGEDRWRCAGPPPWTFEGALWEHSPTSIPIRCPRSQRRPQKCAHPFAQHFYSSAIASGPSLGMVDAQAPSNGRRDSDSQPGSKRPHPSWTPLHSILLRMDRLCGSAATASPKEDAYPKPFGDGSQNCLGLAHPDFIPNIAPLKWLALLGKAAECKPRPAAFGGYCPVIRMSVVENPQHAHTASVQRRSSAS